VGIGGLGYMGLTTGLAFAYYGARVVGYDVNVKLREQLQRGATPVYEKGLAQLLRAQRRRDRFRVAENWTNIVEACETIFLCLPTPRQPTGRIDLRPIRAGTRELGRALRSAPGYRLVVVKSTVVPGTTETVLAPVLEKESRRGPGSLGVAANPEFLSEGRMVHDALHPSRVVIGTRSPGDARRLRRLYRPFGAPVVDLTPTGAELVKYLSNEFLALKVSFANEASRLAESLGVNVDAAMQGVGFDPRIGSQFLAAGPGFGGSCFEKDIRALVARGRELGIPLLLARAVLAANAAQTTHAADLVRGAVGELSGKTIAVLGLSFKAGTDDVRESRALPIVQQLLAAGAWVRLHDPVALENFRRLWSERPGPFSDRLTYCSEVEAALAGADVAVLQAGWPEYLRWPRRWSDRMREAVVVDLRRALAPSVRRRAGLRWVGLGVGPGAIPPE
jgi:UDPglucose 6-dehydrogenase